MSAWTIARLETDQICQVTEESLIPASCSSLSRRWISRPRLSTWVFGSGSTRAPPDRLFGHQAGPDHPVSHHVSEPLGVGHVGLSARDVLDVLRTETG
jgi:hypothetical protein